MARMHGAFWEMDLSGCDWLMTWAAPSLRLGIPFAADSWSRRHGKFDHLYPAELDRLVSEFWMADTETCLGLFLARPATFAHTDLELDNVVFVDDAAVVLDWQTGMWSFPGHDLGWLLSSCHNAETLPREPELLELYLREFAAAGGPAWSIERLLDDLAWGVFYPCSVSHVIYANALEASASGNGDQRAKHKFEAMLVGAIAAAGRWGTVERVGAAA